MKNVKFPLLGLSFLLLASSCKKDDFQESGAAALLNAPASTEEANGWKSAAQWDVADQQTFSVHYFTIEDSAITSDVADNGLVLVFKKNGASINALPFEETAVANVDAASDGVEQPAANYWYHQITEGSLLISCDEYAAGADAANSFKYFVLTPEKLESLKADGYTTEKLMGLSYDDAAALLEGIK